MNSDDDMQVGEEWWRLRLARVPSAHDMRFSFYTMSASSFSSFGRLSWLGRFGPFGFVLVWSGLDGFNLVKSSLGFCHYNKDDKKKNLPFDISTPK